MSEILGDLRRQAKTLRLISQDVANLPADWSMVVDSTHVLGPGAPVDAWYLAEHFLRSWSDWHGLRVRYSRYFGGETIANSKSWEKDDSQYAEQARRISADERLQELIAQSWRSEFGGDNVDPELNAAALFHGIISSHEAMLLSTSLWPSPRTIGQGIDDVARGRNQWLKCAYDRATTDARHDLTWQLRNYRHATLQLSWLNGNGDQPHGLETALEHALADDERAARLAETLIEPTLHELRRDDDRKVVRRVVRAVSEVGYEHFFDDVTSREMRGGRDSPLGAEGVEVIPGGLGLPGAAVLVALSRRGRRGASLETTLVKVCQRLAESDGAARTAVLVSDTWDASLFAAVARDHFAEHHARGVGFVFLVVGSPPQIVSPVPVLLNGQSTESGPYPPLRRLKTD